MTRRAKVWLVVAVIFSVINLLGTVPAFLAGEAFHGAIHVALFLVGTYWMRRLWHGEGAVVAASPRDYTDRLTNLEQSVDAVAVEVERIGEGQRFITQLFTENSGSRAPAEGAAEPVEIKAPPKA